MNRREAIFSGLAAAAASALPGVAIAVPELKVWVRFPSGNCGWHECPYYQDLTPEENVKEWSRNWEGAKHGPDGKLIRDESGKVVRFPHRAIAVVLPSGIEPQPGEYIQF